MPTIHLYSHAGGTFSEDNFAAFRALCARLGITEVLASGKRKPDHFYAVGPGIIVDYWADWQATAEVAARIIAAGITVLPYAGHVSLDFEFELERLEEQVKEIARHAAGRFLLACPKCHRAVGNDKYCPYCGAACDSHLQWCSRCKMGYPPSFAHCTRCGGPLGPTGQWVFDYCDPEDIFDGVYLTEAEANKPPDEFDYG